MDWNNTSSWAPFVAAAATLTASVVALFLRELRSWLRPLKLDMQLSREHGLAVTTRIYPPGQAIPANSRTEKSRYYHLRVSNPRRKADAVNGVVVVLQHVESKGRDGKYHEIWNGDIPLHWRNELPDDAKKIVGTPAEADLCSVVRDKWLALPLKFEPIDLPSRFPVDGELPVDIVVTIQAKGNEVDSEVKRWRIFWDGKWVDGDREMTRHFHVTGYEG